MNREKELVLNTIILVIGKISTQFINFILLPFYTMYLTPEEFGVFDLLNTYIVLIVPIFNWQIENGMFRFMLDCRDNHDSQTQIFSTVLCSNFFQVFMYLCFFAIMQSFIKTPYKNFLAVDVSCNIFLNTFLQLSRGIGRTTKYAISSFILALSTVLLNIIFITVFNMGVYGLFFSTIISKIITIIYIIINIKIWNYFRVSKFSKEIFFKIFKYSLPLVPNQLSWWVVGTSDRTIISHFISVTVNGIYSVANKFSALFITFYNVFHLSWTESVTTHITDKDSESFITEIINSILKLIISICYCFITIVPFMFPLFVNKQYEEAYYQIPILVIAALFQVVVGLYSVIYTALKKSAEIMKTSLYAAIINITINILFIKIIGLYAASISTLIAYMVMAIYRCFHVKQFFNIKIEKKIIFSGIILGILSVLTYYIRLQWLHIFSLAIVVFYSVFLNRKLLFILIQFIIKLKKR